MSFTCFGLQFVDNFKCAICTDFNNPENVLNSLTIICLSVILLLFMRKNVQIPYAASLC